MKLIISAKIIIIFSLFFLMLFAIISGNILSTPTAELTQPFTAGLLGMLVFFLGIALYKFFNIPIIELRDNNIWYRTIFKTKADPIGIESYFKARYQNNRYEILYLITENQKLIKIDEQFYRNYNDIKSALVKGLKYNDGAKAKKVKLLYQLISAAMLVIGVCFLIASFVVNTKVQSTETMPGKSPVLTEVNDGNLLCLKYGLLFFGIMFTALCFFFIYDYKRISGKPLSSGALRI